MVLVTAILETRNGVGRNSVSVFVDVESFVTSQHGSAAEASNKRLLHVVLTFPPRTGGVESEGPHRAHCPEDPMPTHRKYTDDQIVAILQEHQGEVTAKEIIRRHGISLDTFYRWKRKYSGLGKVELQRLKALEDENRRLKRVVADQALNIQVLKDALGKEW
jgi:putative transposase